MVEPWIFEDDISAEVEVFEVPGKPPLEVPRYGSLTIDEAQYMEWAQAKYGLNTSSISAISDIVWGLLLLRFRRAAWSESKLISTTDKPLPKQRRMLPPDVAQQVYALFIDEFQTLLGKSPTALNAIRESLKAGSPSIGDFSTTIRTGDTGEEDSDEPPSTSSDPPSNQLKTKKSGKGTTQTAPSAA